MSKIYYQKFSLSSKLQTLIECVALRPLNTYIFFVLTRIPSTFITHQAFSIVIDLSLRPKVTDGIKPTCDKASCFQSISNIVSQNKMTKTFFQPIFCIATLPKVLILFSFLLLNNYSMSATCIRGL